MRLVYNLDSIVPLQRLRPTPRDLDQQQPVIEVVNAYVGQKAINETSIVFYTNIEARSENYGGWKYSIAPITPQTEGMYPTEIQIRFQVEKSRSPLTASSIENLLLGSTMTGVPT